MLPPTVAMFLICGDAVSDDGHAVADGQRLGRQHLFIRRQKRRGPGTLSASLTSMLSTLAWEYGQRTSAA